MSELIIEFLMYAFAGASVGFVVGMTGVGGGSLMTPILVSVFGIKMAVAVGTDLLYAAITKSNGVFSHARQNTVEWCIVKHMLLGSVPASLITSVCLFKLSESGVQYDQYLTVVLGVMLILTACVLLLKSRIAQNTSTASFSFNTKATACFTTLSGVALGVLVTLSSVGAGAFGAALLMVMYPKLSAIKIIGTDLAHAVPLTLIAGVGHLFHAADPALAEAASSWRVGNVDFQLLMGLLVGSLPAIWVGTKCANRVPDKWMRPAMACVLLLLGIKYTFL